MIFDYFLNILPNGDVTMKLYEKPQLSTENLLPSLTNFLMDNCSKRIKSRYDSLVDDITRYNESVLEYNQKIKEKNLKLVKSKKIIKKAVIKSNKINNTNVLINQKNNEVEQENIKTEEANVEVANKQIKNEYEEFKEKELKMKLSYARILPSNTPLISDIMNNIRNKNNKYLINGSAIGEKEDDYGIFSVLKFEKKNDIIWGNEAEIRSYLPQLHKFMLLDLINNEERIKEDFLKTYSKSDDVYNNTNYIYKINNFVFEDILCEFIPYAISSIYRQIIPKEMDSTSIQKYYGVTIHSQEYYDRQRTQAIEFLYTLPDYRQRFNKIIINYIDNDFFVIKNAPKKNDDKKATAINNPFNDKFLENDLIIPKIIPFLIDYFYQKDSLGKRVQNIIKYDLSKSREMIERYENGDVPFEMHKEINRASSYYAYQLSEIQKKYLCSPQIADTDTL